MAKMIKILFRLLAVLGVVLLLGVLTLVAVMVFVDPNDYREEIVEAVHEQTGRDLTIGGEIGLTFFPKIGVSLNRVSLSNAEGFDAPFAEVDEVAIGVAIVPLIRGELVMDTTRLIGLRLNLGRNAQGVANWEDLIEASGGADRETTDHGAGGEPLAGLAIGGVEIRDAAIVWDDRQAAARYEVNQLSLTTGAIAFGSPFDLTAGFDFTSSEPAMKGRFTLSGEVFPDPENGRIDGLDLKLDITGDTLPGGSVDLRLRGDLASNMQQQLATFDNLRLNLLGIEATGSLEFRELAGAPRSLVRLKVASLDLPELLTRLDAKLPDGARPDLLGNAALELVVASTPETVTVERFNIITDLVGLRVNTTVRNLAKPQVTGTVQLDDFKLRELLTAVGTELDTADATAFSSASFNADFTASQTHVEVERFSLGFDDSKLQGTAGVKNFDKPAIRFALNLDAIDADRYLPPASEEVAASPAAAAPAAAQLPLETLRALDIDGTLRIGKLKVTNVRSERIEMRLVASGGKLRLNPVSANLYGGTYSGDIGLDARKDVPRMSLDEKLDGVQVGPLLKDMTGDAPISGKARLAAKLTADGVDPDQVQRTLNGTASFAFTDGALEGFNLAGMIRDAYARLKGQPVTATNEPNSTDFTELSGTFKATNGLLDNRDLSMKSPLIRVAGAGTANLPTQALDYGVKASIVGTLQGQGGPINDLKGVTIPVRITGTFTEPKFGIDLASVLTDQVKQRAQQEVQKAISEKLGGSLPGGAGSLLPGGGSTGGSGSETTNPPKPADAIKGVLEGLFK